MEKKYRILMIHNRYRIPGGEDTVVENEVKMLRRHGHEVFLYERDNNEVDAFSIVDKLLLPFRTIYSYEAKREINRIIKNQSIDIVHVHNTFHLISFSVYDAAFSLNKPVVQTLHNFRFICTNGLLYRNGTVCEECIHKGITRSIGYGCYRNSRAQSFIMFLAIQRMLNSGILNRIKMIALSEFSRNLLIQSKYVPEKNVCIKPNFVKAQNYIPYQSRKKQIVFAGRLDEIKGIRFVLSVWNKLGDDALELIICGDGPLFEECRSFIREHDLKNVVMKGFILKEEIINLLRNSIAMIFASRVYENFPMSIVESFSCGTPVIAPQFGNAGIMVKDGVNGYLYEQNSEDSCIQAIKKVINDIDKDYSGIFTGYYEEDNYRMLMDIYKRAIEDFR